MHPDGEEADSVPAVVEVQEFPVQQEQTQDEPEDAKLFADGEEESTARDAAPVRLVPIDVVYDAMVAPMLPGTGHDAGNCMEHAPGVQPADDEASIETAVVEQPFPMQQEQAH